MKPIMHVRSYRSIPSGELTAVPAGTDGKKAMRTTTTLITAVLMMLGLFAGTAGAQGHEGPVPEHGHIKLLHVEYDEAGEPVGYAKCIDVAGGNLNSHAHHTTIHQGRAGQALGEAGHMVVPTANLTPWANCAEFAAFVGIAPSS